jgi:hypothetical protein
MIYFNYIFEFFSSYFWNILNKMSGQSWYW